MPGTLQKDGQEISFLKGDRGLLLEKQMEMSKLTKPKQVQASRAQLLHLGKAGTHSHAPTFLLPLCWPYGHEGCTASSFSANKPPRQMTMPLSEFTNRKPQYHFLEIVYRRKGWGVEFVSIHAPPYGRQSPKCLMSMPWCLHVS